MKHKLILIGFGVVGQGLTEILISKKDFLQQKFGFEYEIVAVSDLLKGSIANPQGLDPIMLLDLVKSGKKLNEYSHGTTGMDALTTINRVDADIMIEVSYTDVKTGEPATSHCRAAFQRGMHVVTTNKGPVALFYHDLKKLASSKGLMFGIEGTVMSGTPVLNTGMKSLAGCNFTRISGILNGTTNFILTEMEQGKSYEAALKKAQELGYAEADPTGDVEGWDALAKVIILSNVLMGGNVKFQDAEREGITKITLEDVQKAKAEGARWKLIGETSIQEGKIKAKVAPKKLPLSDPLASVMGATNAITFETDLMGNVTVIGKGAGKIETGFSVLSDLLDIHRTVTGR
ncbi:MAG: homoserine dehydrogenase [candidate division KSB1 bacterium]|nr:homoserine dehydrogenase [candidate division KSB1 bacterium]MDZ7334515.1 homoserine dehydrogenase [candidate division KSB1 bacterium]MDZ7356962.1 homoserine dehydrogenase [candidate division KSB1 bacterium]MDZ7400976.1 homoserine dehydrogenase [candidate division KSB1 bacterium]